MRTNNVLQLKITLSGSRPSIWRRIFIPAIVPFFDLHVAIQDAFGWMDCHLHQFHTTEPYKRGSVHRNIIGFPVPEMEDVLDERYAKLSEWLKVQKSKIWYEYDFGDTWIHEVKVEKIIPLDLKIRYPHLADGANACPPEDCGGLGGYYHLLKILQNPKNKEHEDTLEWLGIESASDFNPEYFDTKDIKFRNPKKILRQYEKHFRL